MAYGFKSKFISFVLLLCFLFLTSTLFAGGNEKLSEIHHRIIRDYPNLQHLDATSFESINKNEVVIFDVRKQEEFEVSHLQGAIRVPPNMSPANFISTFGEQSKGKTLVFYCSVGQRSSELASRIQSKLSAAEQARIYNLEGGIFRWHNDHRNLVSGTQVSDFVHPYSWFQRGLLDRSDKIRYKQSHRINTGEIK